MTSETIPVSAPHGKAFYVMAAVFASLFGLGFLWGALAKGSLAGVPLDAPIVWRVVRAGVAAVLLSAARQAFERLLAPARAQARSAAISGVARSGLLGLRTLLLAMGVAGGMIYLFAHLRGRPVPDAIVLSAVFTFAGASLADLCGERR